MTVNQKVLMVGSQGPTRCSYETKCCILTGVTVEIQALRETPAAFYRFVFIRVMYVPSKICELF